MKARLIKREEIIPSFWEIEFEPVNEQIVFEPGQFFNLTLIHPHVTDDRGYSRYFGFTNLPNQPTFKMLMKTGISAFKKTLLSLPEETEVEIDKIGGENNIAKNPNSPLVFVVCGVGIAPVISMIRFYFEKNLTNKLVLFYANYESEALPFVNELQDLEKRGSNFKLVLTKDLNELILRENLPDFNNYLYFIRGASKFVITSMQVIKSLGVEQNKISIEIFTGY